MLLKTTVSIGFACSSCGGELNRVGAIRTEDDLLYIVGYCDTCNETVPIPIDKIITTLYQKPGKRLVN